LPPSLTLVEVAAGADLMSNVDSVITTTTNTVVVSANSAVSIGRWSNLAIIAFSFLSLWEGGEDTAAATTPPPWFLGVLRSWASPLLLPPPLELASCAVCCRGSVLLFYWQVVGEFRVAGPGLEGGQVAVLRLHAAFVGHVTRAAYSCVGEMYVRHGTKHGRAPRKRRISENSVKANFAEILFHALR
jgi:hypothetical protein